MNRFLKYYAECLCGYFFVKWIYEICKKFNALLGNKCINTNSE